MQGRSRGSKTDLLIWPESAVPSLNETNYIAITNLICPHHVWLILNAEDAVWRAEAKNRDDFDVFNAAFLLDPAGRFAAVYHKQKLVVFGEYIPLVRWLPFIKWFTPITGSFASGTNAVPFEMERWGERLSGRSQTKTDPREPFGQTNDIPPSGSPGVSPHQKVKTSTLICFEDMFPELAREYVQDDTDFLVNLTNDGWFGDSAEQWQHAAGGVFRAVENGVPLVRCCNNGVTCWIDATGRVREILKDQNGSVYGIGAMTIEIPLQKHAPTFYNRHGDRFGWGCVILASVLLLKRIFIRKGFAAFVGERNTENSNSKI
jgi:apolipoprotein N-acyltransferase